MRTMMPIILILVFLSLTSFYYFGQKARIRREKRQEKMREKYENLLNTLHREDERKESNKETD